MMIPAPKLDITLEPRTAAHAEELFAMLSEPEIYRYLDEDPPQSIEALKKKFARSESRKSPDGSEHWLNWVVRDELQFVAGIVQTTIYPSGEANVAYVFGRAQWGRNLAYRAVERMLHLVVDEFEVKQFFVTIERDNERSIRLAERLGFVSATVTDFAARTIAAGDVLMLRHVAATLRQRS